MTTTANLALEATLVNEPATATMHTSVALLLAIAAALTGSGCAAVPPWQRGDLAKRCMTAGLGEDGFNAQYRAKVIESVTGGGLPGDAPGGGCGCTQ